MGHSAERDAATYRVLSPNPGSTDGWSLARGFGLLRSASDDGDLSPTTGGLDEEVEVIPNE